MSVLQGRPSVSKQYENEKLLRPYFAKAFSASFTARQTGINIKTVCKYFDKWAQEIRQVDEQDFILKQKNERERIILSLDDLIYQEYNILDDIKSEIKKFKDKEQEIPKYFLNSFQDVIKTISSLIEKKGLFVIQPALDDVIKQKLEEKNNV